MILNRHPVPISQAEKNDRLHAEKRRPRRRRARRPIIARPMGRSAARPLPSVGQTRVPRPCALEREARQSPAVLGGAPPAPDPARAPERP